MATDKYENLYCQTCYIHTSKKDTNKTTFYDKNPIHLFNASIIHDADEESNLTPDQRDLLLLHKRYGHISMPTIQRMCTKGTFGQKYKHLGRSTIKIPACKTCITGAQSKTTNKSKGNKH